MTKQKEDKMTDAVAGLRVVHNEDDETYTVYDGDTQVGLFISSWDAQRYIDNRFVTKGKPMIAVLLKRILIVMMVSPLLTLAYHKGLSEYVEFLWPTATISGAAVTGIIALVGAFASGIFIATHWK